MIHGVDSKINRRGGASHLPAAPNRNGSSEDHVMAVKSLPSPGVLRQLLRYEPDTGKLFWLPRGPEWFATVPSSRTWNSRYAGGEAGTVGMAGYINVRVGKHVLLGHRVAWAITYGSWPKGMLDHANGVKVDNRLVNLRQASASENGCNRPASSKNPSGLKGAYYLTRENCWTSVIKYDGRRKYLGQFKTPEEAHAAYISAARKLHGDFAWEPANG